MKKKLIFSRLLIIYVFIYLFYFILGFFGEQVKNDFGNCDVRLFEFVNNEPQIASGMRTVVCFGSSVTAVYAR